MHAHHVSKVILYLFQGGWLKPRQDAVSIRIDNSSWRSILVIHEIAAFGTSTLCLLQITPYFQVHDNIYPNPRANPPKTGEVVLAKRQQIGIEIS